MNNFNIEDLKESEKINQELEENSKKTAENIGKTYKNMSQKIYDTIKHIYTKIANTAKESGKQVLQYENNKMVALVDYENEVTKVLKNSVYKSEKERSKDFDNLKKNLKLKQISEEEYYLTLARIRDEYLVKGSADWAKYTVDILNYNKKMLSEQSKLLKETFSDIDKEYEEKFNGILKKQEDMYKKLTGISDIYNKVSVGSGDQTYTWLQLSNVEYEVKALEEYNNALIKVKNRVNEIFDSFGLDKKKLHDLKTDFFGEIAKMNISDGIGFSNYLMGVTDEKLTSFIEKWIQKMDLSEAISKNLYSDDVDAVVKMYTSDLGNALTSQMTEALSNLPDFFYDSGTDACIEFQNGFLQTIDQVMLEITDEINKKLKQFQIDAVYQNSGTTVTNNANYTIYESNSPELTALEIYKQDIKKRMLVK